MTETPPPTPDVPAGLVGRLGRDQVFGTPVVQGNTTLVPVARVRAGAGRRGAEGGGAGIVARPLGAFSVSSDGRVRWHPAVDVNRIIMGGQIVAIVAITVTAIVRRRQQGAWLPRLR